MIFYMKHSFRSDKMSYMSPKSTTDTVGKTKKKPTLYFSELELKKLDQVANERSNYYTDSLATTIETIVRAKLDKVKLKKVEKE